MTDSFDTEANEKPRDQRRKESDDYVQEFDDTLLSSDESEMPASSIDFDELDNPFGTFGDLLSGSPFSSDLFDTAYEAVAKSLGLDHLLGDDDLDLPEEDEEEDLLTREEAVDILTMALLYLTSHRGQASTTVAQEVIDRLRARRWIDSGGAGSISLTDEGAFVGQESLATFGFDYLAFEEEEADTEHHGWRLIE